LLLLLLWPLLHHRDAPACWTAGRGGGMGSGIAGFRMADGLRY
jgi:hypothetical protein